MTTEAGQFKKYHWTVADSRLAWVSVETNFSADAKEERRGIAEVLRRIADEIHPLWTPAEVFVPPEDEEVKEALEILADDLKQPGRWIVPEGTPIGFAVVAPVEEKKREIKRKFPDKIREFSKKKLLAGLTCEEVATAICEEFKVKIHFTTIYAWRRTWARHGTEFPKRTRWTTARGEVPVPAERVKPDTIDVTSKDPGPGVNIETIFAFAKGRLLNKEHPSVIAEAIRLKFGYTILPSRIERWGKGMGR